MDVTDAVAAERQRVVGFADVIRIPLRRWRTVLAVTAAVTLAVIGYLQLVPATYTATSVVVLRPVVTDPFTYPSGGADRAINMTAENGIASSNDVIDTTARILGRTAEDTRDALTIEVPTGGQVLRFDYTDTTEKQAVIGANAAAETYLRVRENIYKQQRAALLLSYDNTIRLVTDQRRKAQNELPETLNSDTSSPSIQAVLDQVRALNDQVAQLANQRAKIGSADLSPGAVTAAARAPLKSSHDAGALYLVGGLLGGALLGMIAAHLREVFDRRIRSAEQAAEVTGLPALGVVRASRRGGGRGAHADAGYIGLAVTQWIERDEPLPVVVLSSRADEGRTQVAGGLAVAMAQAGHDVYLGAAPESHDELRRILFAAQQRTPPVLRTSAAAANTGGLAEPDEISDTVVIPVQGGSAANGTGTAAFETGFLEAVGFGVGISKAGGAGSGGAGSGGAGSGGAGSGGQGFGLEGPVIRPAPRTGPRGVPPVVSPVTRGASAGATSLDDRRPLSVLIGAGAVRLGPLGTRPADGVVVIDAPPADTDERGVRAAQSGVAVLVLGCDRTRNGEVGRLLNRLRSVGAQTVGFVLTGGRSA
jgi:capsular polysaccharide biosynthesis protein